MGNRPPSLQIEYKEAARRLGPKLVDKYTAAFDRISVTEPGSGKHGMTYGKFKAHLLQVRPQMPKKLMVVLLHALSGDGTEIITLEDFIRGVAMLGASPPLDTATALFLGISDDGLGVEVSVSRLLAFRNAIMPTASKDDNANAVIEAYRDIGLDATQHGVSMNKKQFLQFAMKRLPQDKSDNPTTTTVTASTKTSASTPTSAATSPSTRPRQLRSDDWFSWIEPIVKCVFTPDPALRALSHRLQATDTQAPSDTPAGRILSTRRLRVIIGALRRAAAETAMAARDSTGSGSAGITPPGRDVIGFGRLQALLGPACSAGTYGVAHGVMRATARLSEGAAAAGAARLVAGPVVSRDGSGPNPTNCFADVGVLTSLAAVCIGGTARERLRVALHMTVPGLAAWASSRRNERRRVSLLASAHSAAVKPVTATSTASAASGSASGSAGVSTPDSDPHDTPTHAIATAATATAGGGAAVTGASASASVTDGGLWEAPSERYDTTDNTGSGTEDLFPVPAGLLVPVSSIVNLLCMGDIVHSALECGGIDCATGVVSHADRIASAAGAAETAWKHGSAGRAGSKTVELLSALKLSDPTSDSVPVEQLAGWVRRSQGPSFAAIEAVSRALSVGSGVAPVSLTEQGRVLRSLLEPLDPNHPTVQHQKLYCVSSDWWCHFVEATNCDVAGVAGYDTKHLPTPTGSAKLGAASIPPKPMGKGLAAEPETLGFVHNAPITDPGSQSLLRVDAVVGRDFVLLPERAWRCLEGWYGHDVRLQRTVIRAAPDVLLARKKRALPAPGADGSAESSTGGFAAFFGFGRAKPSQRSHKSPTKSVQRPKGSVSGVGGSVGGVGGSVGPGGDDDNGGEEGGVGALEVELYPIPLAVRSVTWDGSIARGGSAYLFSRCMTVEAMLAKCCGHLRLKPELCRLWYRHEPAQDSPVAKLSALTTVKGGQLILLNEQDATADELDLSEWGEFAVESRQSDSAAFPRDGMETGSTNHKSRVGRAGSASAIGVGRTGQEQEDDALEMRNLTLTSHGSVGLSNLGNTCYLGSGLQALCHTPPLAEYFLRRRHLFDVSTREGLGQGGLMTAAFAELVRDVWAGERRAIAPRRIKTVAGMVRTDFQGFRQQDAQEAVDVVTNTLGDELNRVSVKPYTELPDSAGRADAEVAEEWWSSHLWREASIVTALFHGQFKSTLVCDCCGWERCQYEPFGMLQLPLPEPEEKLVHIVVHRMRGERPVTLGVLALLTDTLDDVIDMGLKEMQSRCAKQRMSQGSKKQGLPPIATETSVGVAAVPSASASAASVDKDHEKDTDVEDADEPGAHTDGLFAEFGAEFDGSAYESLLPPADHLSALSSDNFFAALGNNMTQATTVCHPDDKVSTLQSNSCIHLYERPAHQDMTESLRLKGRKVALVPGSLAYVYVEPADYVAPQTPTSTDDGDADRSADTDAMTPSADTDAMTPSADTDAMTPSADTTITLPDWAKNVPEPYTLPPINTYILATVLGESDGRFMLSSSQPVADSAGGVPSNRLVAHSTVLQPCLGNPQRIVLQARRLRRLDATSHFLNDLTYEKFGIPYHAHISANDLSCHELYRLVHSMLARWMPSLDKGPRSSPPEPATVSARAALASSSSSVREGWVEAGADVLVHPDKESNMASLTEVDVMRDWGFALKRQQGTGQRGLPSDWRVESEAGTLIRPWLSRTAGLHVRCFRAQVGTADDVGVEESTLEQATKALLSSTAQAARPDAHTSMPAGVFVSDGPEGRVLAVSSSRVSAGAVATETYVGFGGENILANEIITVDIDPAILDQTDVTDAAVPDFDDSIRRCAMELERPLSLLRCLDTFSRPEQLDDESYCPRCSKSKDPDIGDVTLRKHHKRMQLWRMPPVLVIQLKRFQHTRAAGRKLGNLVTFPLASFDTKPFLAVPTTRQPAPDLTSWLFLGGKMGPAGIKTGRAASRASALGASASPSSAAKPSRLFPGRVVGSTEKAVAGMPLTITREATVYDLYSVVYHMGALGGGHYVASAKSFSDGKWRMFNDSQVKEIPASDVQLKEAYLLFYLRRDVRDTDVDDLFPAMAGAKPVDLEALLAEAAASSRCQVM